MTDDIYRQRKKISREDLDPESETPNDDPLSSVRQIQQAMANETGQEIPTPLTMPFEVKGNVPPEFKDQLARINREPAREPIKSSPKPRNESRAVGSDQFESLINKLTSLHQWEEFEFPSKGKFYNNIPPVVHIRAMTGEEEQILATPRYVKRGKAIDLIFQRCVRENISTEELLSVDRTHLLIYLRGISYTPHYDVEVKCPECSTKFQTIIDLNSLEIDQCPEDFGPDKLEGTLPTSGFRYRYRLALGRDEQQISQYRELKIQEYGDQSEDDTLLYRTALLLEEIESVTALKEIQFILKKLPIADLSYLRNEINQPPFGVRTEVPLLCPSCTEGFKIDLPLETSFFFPRKREERTQA